MLRIVLWHGFQVACLGYLKARYVAGSRMYFKEALNKCDYMHQTKGVINHERLSSDTGFLV